MNNIFEKTKKPAENDVYRHLFERMGSAFFIADVDTGNIVECNAEAEKLIGRPRDRIVGMHQSKLYPEDEEERYAQEFAAHAHDGRIDNYEAEVQNGDGRRIPVIISARAFELRGRRLIMGIFVDLTERKRVEEALHESEEKYHALINDASDGILLADTNGRILEANKMAVHLFGYTKEDFKEMHFSQLHPPEESQRVTTAFRLLRQRGEGFLTDILILRKDGTTLPVDMLGNVIMYENNRVMMGVFRDISERKKIDQMKDNLIRDVSHELKTPIAMMEMALGMQQQAIEAGDYDEIRNAWRIGCRNLKTLSKDVNNVLKMFSLGAKMAAPQRRRISLKRMADEVIRELRDLIAQKKLKIEVDIPPVFDKIHADRKMIRTLIYNIIENAIKFTRYGAVYIAVQVSGKEIFFRVKDTGCGIKLKDKSVLFTRFFKQDPSMQGTGLGLPICKEIAAIYGGSIEVDSEGVGKGATVTVKLPRATVCD